MYSSKYDSPYSMPVLQTTEDKINANPDLANSLPEGKFVFTKEKTYGNKTLIGNWQEDMSDLRNSKDWKHHLCNYNHSFMTTYGTGFCRIGTLVPHKYELGRRCPIPAHQPELDPIFLRCPQYYRSISQTSFRDPWRKREKVKIPTPATRDSFSQTYPSPRVKEWNARFDGIDTLHDI